jgi:hypothetical protein
MVVIGKSSEVLRDRGQHEFELYAASSPKRDAPQLQERCDLLCPDLPKVL